MFAQWWAVTQNFSFVMLRHSGALGKSIIWLLLIAEHEDSLTIPVPQALE